MGWDLIRYWLFLWLVMVLARMQYVSGCLDKERMGLLEIRAFFDSQGADIYSHRLDSWVDDRESNCCDWDLVKCNLSTGHVTELSLHNFIIDYRQKWYLNVSLFHRFEELRILDLSFNGFDGLVEPQGFSNLKKLEILNLSSNNFNNSVLPSLSALTSLRTLKMESNGIEGSFPAQDLANLKNLEMLDLSFNGLSGPLLAKDFINWRNLKMLGLGSNLLNGSFPFQGICEMKNLVEVDLSRNNFTGQLHECLSSLTNLRAIELSHNQFSGKFPSFITNLTSLEYFSLLENRIEGSFSLSSLANHSKLEVLHFSSQTNGLTVETENPKWHPTFQLKSLILQGCNLNLNSGRAIPSFLLHQNDLQFVDLSDNHLPGKFPSWLVQNNSRLNCLYLKNNSFSGNFMLPSSKLWNIYFLDISNNKFSGWLPSHMGIVLPNITSMNLSMNSFGGKIPSSIGEMKELQILDLSHNNFIGELPASIARNCTMLRYLKLSNNFLQGPIILRSSEWMSWLYLNNNNFSGVIEEEQPNFTSLLAVDFSNNSISGKIPGSIVKCQSLMVLLMAENQLEGEIPDELSNLTKLEILDLSHNRLYGSIPNLSIMSLKFLYLQKNALSGSVPSSLTKNSQLVTLDLRDNKLSGNIPHWMNMSKLRVVLLGGNHFEGHIPIELCLIKNVSIMDLSRNKFSGSIPSCFVDLSFGMAVYDNHDSDLQGPSILAAAGWFGNIVDIYIGSIVRLGEVSLENSVGGNAIVKVEFRTKSNYYSYEGNILEHMTGLDLSCNELTGIIPSQIGDLQQIRALNLSHNFLSGPIPKSFSNLTQIESLDLSYNYLSGEIPTELSHLHSLAIFNVSYNNLSGTPPNIGQFATFDDNNYRGNPDLCGPMLSRSCEGTKVSPPPQSKEEEKETIVDMVAFYWSFSASYTIILLGLVTVLCINPQWCMIWFRFIDKFICSSCTQY